LEQKVFSKANACLYLLYAIVSSGMQPDSGQARPPLFLNGHWMPAVRELFDKTAMLD